MLLRPAHLQPPQSQLPHTPSPEPLPLLQKFLLSPPLDQESRDYCLEQRLIPDYESHIEWDEDGAARHVKPDDTDPGSPRYIPVLAAVVVMAAMAAVAAVNVFVALFVSPRARAALRAPAIRW